MVAVVEEIAGILYVLSLTAFSSKDLPLALTAIKVCFSIRLKRSKEGGINSCPNRSISTIIKIGK
jgi:hypothetical protein